MSQVKRAKFTKHSNLLGQVHGGAAQQSSQNNLPLFKDLLTQRKPPYVQQASFVLKTRLRLASCYPSTPIRIPCAHPFGGSGSSGKTSAFKPQPTPARKQLKWTRLQTQPHTQQPLLTWGHIKQYQPAQRYKQQPPTQATVRKST